MHFSTWAWYKTCTQGVREVETVVAQEEDGVSPTAVREIMLLQETHHENIVRLDSVHINREVRLRPSGSNALLPGETAAAQHRPSYATVAPRASGVG